LAISADHIYSHNVFSASLGMLPYPLLSDWHKQTIKAYNVFNEEKEIAKRSVFLVNQEGVIVFKNTEFAANNRAHYEEVFAEMEKLSMS
jgi:peroxiredoxin